MTCGYWKSASTCGKHTRRPGEPSSMVTVLVDLTPVVDGTRPARLIDMRAGRSAEVLRTWQPRSSRGVGNACNGKPPVGAGRRMTRCTSTVERC